jgi:hypothetical protein
MTDKPEENEVNLDPADEADLPPNDAKTLRVMTDNAGIGKPPTAATQLMSKLATKETVLLVFECAEPTPMHDEQGLMIPVGNTGKLFMQKPKDDTWRMLLPHDVPEWLKTDQALTRLVAGEELSMYPEKGGRFYRVHQLPQTANFTVEAVARQEGTH